MSSDPNTVERVRRLLKERPDVVEKRIVGGGLGFLVSGHLCCAVSSRGLTVRVGPGQKAEALSHRDVEPLRIGSRETAAFIVVAPAGYKADADLRRWVERGLRFVATLQSR